MAKSMYDIIKKQNGEHFAKAIRCYDNGIFDIPSLDRIVKYAGRDAEPIMKYLISLKDIQIAKTSTHQDPIKLLNQAGYDAYIADTLEKQNAIKKYFAPGEELCTFRDNKRYERYHIINAVRKDADSLKRADFTNPQREDKYGTSVISIQVLKEGGFISIKNRYNHAVDSCDNTFNSNPDNIILGLADAIQNFFGVDFATTRTDIPRGYRLLGDQICKYNQEINNVYVGDNYYIADGHIHDIDTQHEVMLGGGLVFDIVNKRTTNVADLFMETHFIDDAFRGKSFQQTKDKKTGIRTLTANGAPIIQVLNGDMISINTPGAKHVQLANLENLRGELDFSQATTIDLSQINTKNISKIKFNPNATSIKISHTVMPPDSYDFSGASTLIMNNVDISKITGIKTKPDASHVVISNTAFPACDFDFSGVHILGLPNCDLSAVKSLKFNPTGYRINLRGAKLPAKKFDLSCVQDVILDGANISQSQGINLNPNNTYTGITPTDAALMIARYHQR